MSKLGSPEGEPALFDHLDRVTELPTRAVFEEFLEASLSRARRHAQPVAVLYLDLDNFKLVNNSFGHATGDDVLRRVGRRLTEILRGGDLLARLGGDEFLILLADLQQGDGQPGATVPVDPITTSEAVAWRVQETLRRPFIVDGTELVVSASIGISVFPLDAADSKTLLRNAAEAAHRAKHERRGGVATFLSGATDPRTKLALAARLHRAAREHQWALHYQPIVNLLDGRMIGVEALIRWNDPTHGIVPASKFLSAAEELGLIDSIGEWVLQELFAQARRWTDAGIDLEISLNLSPQELWHPDLVNRVIGQLSGHRLDASRIVIEITETAAMRDPVRTSEVLLNLRGHGVRFAIDDFGTGYSSLSRLRELPVEMLKIDRSFVSGVPGDRSTETLVRAMIQLAHSLEMTAVAEGIETEDQRRFLVAEGCALGQGFHLSRPVPAEEIERLANRQSRVPAASGARGGAPDNGSPRSETAQHTPASAP